MDISIKDGSFYFAENLVLHIHSSLHTVPTRLNAFVGNIYEGYPAFQSDDCFPLLVCSGKGYREFEATLACIDVLLGYNYPKGLRFQMEKWILENHTLKATGCSLFMQIRYKGVLQDPRIHTVGLPEISKYFPGSYISQMVR